MYDFGVFTHECFRPIGTWAAKLYSIGFTWSPVASKHAESLSVAGQLSRARKDGLIRPTENGGLCFFYRLDCHRFDLKVWTNNGYELKEFKL